MRHLIRPPSKPATFTAVVLVAVLYASSPAAAVMLPEEQQGAQIVREIRAGKLSAAGLSSTQYERVGEYVMGRNVGSPALHQRMNTMMETMMGQAATDQLHVYLGKRYLGQVTASSDAGPSMMNGSGSGPSGMMGRGMMGHSYRAHHGLGTAAVAGIVVGAIAVLSAAATILVRRGAR
jgi:hypothetical protein